MSKFRTYKNGVYGSKYHGCYIIPDEKGNRKTTFTIKDEDLNVIREKVEDYDESKWVIDIENADMKDLVMVKKLYQLEIYELTRLLMELMEKGDDLTENEKILDKWLQQVRIRKSKGKPLDA